MAEFFQSWGYLGVFLGIVITGVPLLPLPEELPVVLGGALAGSGNASLWIMLPLCILAVVIGDGMLSQLAHPIPLAGVFTAMSLPASNNSRAAR